MVPFCVLKKEKNNGSFFQQTFCYLFLHWLFFLNQGKRNSMKLYLRRTLVQYNFKQLLSKRRFYHRVTQSNAEKTLCYSVKKLSATLPAGKQVCG